jgi:hypothetical protein
VLIVGLHASGGFAQILAGFVLFWHQTIPEAGLHAPLLADSCLAGRLCDSFVLLT